MADGPSRAERLAALRRQVVQSAAQRDGQTRRMESAVLTLAPDFGDRVAQARHESGLTAKQLADRLGLSVWEVERLERNEEGTAALIPALAGATRRPESWFTATAADDAPTAQQAADDDRPAEAQALPATERIAGGVGFVLGALTLLLVIRALTEIVPLLPRAANFIDIPIFFAIAVAAMTRPAGGSQTRTLTPVLLIAFLFLAVFAGSTMTNLTRVEPAPALMFLYGFLGPVGIFYAAHRLWRPGSSLRISRLLVALGVLQLVLAFGVQLPEYLSTKNPDVITGTFGENAYQLVFFLLMVVGLLAGIFTFEKNRLVAQFVPVLLIAVLAVILLAQYRSLLLTTVLMTLLLSFVLGTARGRGALVAVATVAALVLGLAYIVQSIPELKFGSAIGKSREDPAFFLKKRFGTANVVGRLFTDEPRFALTGTGPGTYSSRGWQTFATSQGSASASNVAGDYVKVLTNGREYTTDVSAKYVIPQLREAEVVDGSRALTSPYASYTSLLAEVGVFGFVLIVALYLWAFFHSLRMTLRSTRQAKDGDTLPALLCATTVAFFVLLQMAALENWFEVTRLTFLSWMLLAVVTKEFEARTP